MSFAEKRLCGFEDLAWSYKFQALTTTTNILINLFFLYYISLSYFKATFILGEVASAFRRNVNGKEKVPRGTKIAGDLLG